MIGARFIITVMFALLAEQAFAQVIEGTATYRERMALPPGAVFEATLEDVSRADAPASVIGSTRLTSPGNPPFAFSITYEPAKIVTNRRYVVRARILLNEKLLFISDQASLVITGGQGTRVSLLLRRVGANPPPSRGSAAERSLQEAYWKAVELGGAVVPSPFGAREPHLLFQPDGRVSGADGCNSITGSYSVKDQALTFGQLAGTQMACAGTIEGEQRFRSALTGTSHWRITGNRLELMDPSGKPLAVFEGQLRTKP